MQTASLTEWLNSPETRALMACLKHRRDQGVAIFLQGLPVPPETQGKSAGCDEILRLLTKTPEEIAKIFDTANRELQDRKDHSK